MEWIVKNLQAVLLFTVSVVFAVIVTRCKWAIKNATNFVIDSLLSRAHIYFIRKTYCPVPFFAHCTAREISCAITGISNWGG